MKQEKLLISAYEKLSAQSVDWESVKDLLSKFLIANK